MDFTFAVCGNVKSKVLKNSLLRSVVATYSYLNYDVDCLNPRDEKNPHQCTVLAVNLTYW